MAANIAGKNPELFEDFIFTETASYGPMQIKAYCKKDHMKIVATLPLNGKMEQFYKGMVKIQDSNYRFDLQSEGIGSRVGAACKDGTYLTDGMYEHILSFLSCDGGFFKKFDGFLEVLDKDKLKERLGNMIKSILAQYERLDKEKGNS